MMQNFLIKKKNNKCLICKNAWTKNSKLEILNISVRLSIQQLREEQDEVQDNNHTGLSDDNPSTPITTIVPIYRPTIPPSALTRTFPCQKPSSVPSLKPSKIQTTYPRQDPSAHPIQQHKHNHTFLLPKNPILHVYILYTPTQTYTQRFVAKMHSLTCVHNLYNNKNISTKTRCQNFQSYIYIYPLQQHKYKHKGFLS